MNSYVLNSRDVSPEHLYSCCTGSSPHTDVINYFNRTMAKPFKWTYQGKALKG
jgi:hypothetical protein